MVDLLLKSGADKEVKDIQGKMAVELASSLGHYGIVRLLAGGILTSKSLKLSSIPYSTHKLSSNPPMDVV